MEYFLAIKVIRFLVISLNLVVYEYIGNADIKKLLSSSFTSIKDSGQVLSSEHLCFF